jgi:hypothetical protein
MPTGDAATWASAVVSLVGAVIITIVGIIFQTQIIEWRDRSQRKRFLRRRNIAIRRYAYAVIFERSPAKASAYFSMALLMTTLGIFGMLLVSLASATGVVIGMNRWIDAAITALTGGTAMWSFTRGIIYIIRMTFILLDMNSRYHELREKWGEDIDREIDAIVLTGKVLE